MATTLRKEAEVGNRLLKPPSCQGCPFYTKGAYYVPDHIIPGSEVMLIAQNPGPDEEVGKLLVKRHWLGGKQYHDEVKDVTPQPLIGATGKLLNERFLPHSGLKREDVSTGNALRCRPGAYINGLKADELPDITSKMSLETSKSDIVKALRHCADAHLRIPESVHTIVAMGSVALFQLTGHSDGMNWRGYVISSTRSDIQSHRTRSTAAYMDVVRQGDRNRYEVDTNRIDIFSTMHIAALHKGDNKRFYHALLRDFDKLGRFMRGTWPVALPQWSIKPPATWPAYSSFDTEYNPDKNNELIRWSMCDIEHNLYCVKADESHIVHIEEKSIVVIQNALADIAHLSNIIDMRSVKVEDLMLAEATLHTGEPHNLNYINSMYGQYNRYKHLSHNEEELYSALDAAEPMHIWVNSIIPEFKKDPRSYAVYRNYMLPLIPIIDKAQQTGARLNGHRLHRVQEIYQARLDVLSTQAQTIADDTSFNVGGLKRLGSMLYASADIKGDLRRDTLIKLQQKFDFESPEYKMIDIRLEYSQKSKLLTSYINNLVNVDRIHPTHLPTQSSFRWSTLNPPLTNFPRACIEPNCPEGEHEWTEQCWSVRDIVLPDEDEVLVSWDHDNIEGRIHDLYLNDIENLKAHEQGLDLHTITCCKMFGMTLPQNLIDPHKAPEDAAWRTKYAWQGKDTQRRVMAKNFNHGSKFTINPKFVYAIPNIEKYGVDRKELIHMAELYMAFKKVIFDRKKKVMQQIKKDKIARNLQGAKRTFYDSSEHTAKEGFSFVISSTVSLYNNETLIMMSRRFPSFRLIHNCHDGNKVCFHKDEVPSMTELRSIIERPMRYEGREVMLTAGIKVHQ